MQCVEYFGTNEKISVGIKLYQNTDFIKSDEDFLSYYVNFLKSLVMRIDENTFVVNVEGEEWSAHTNDSVDVDDTVKVIGINSIILIIEKID